MNEIWKQLPTDLYPKIFMFLEHPEARIIKDWVVNIPSKNRMQVEDKGVYGINIKGYKEAIGFYEWKYMQKRMYPKYMLTLSVMFQSPLRKQERSVAEISYRNICRYYEDVYYSAGVGGYGMDYFWDF
tara:strand:- start:342 stop:725 length:384 start_codon:yes stop_codon:yes gene_type:complete